MAELQRQIKFQLSESGHRLVRLAAALENTTMADFSRGVVLEAAERIVAASGVKLENTKASPKRRKQSGA